MKYRPLLLNGEMVRAVLEGRKTVTRRPVGGGVFEMLRSQSDGSKRRLLSLLKDYDIADLNNLLKTRQSNPLKIFCPYGQVGDRLWVREKTRILSYANGGTLALVRYEADGAENLVPIPERLKRIEKGNCIPNGCHREASRITLEITSVSVESVQDITEEEAKREGIIVDKAFAAIFKDCGSPITHRSEFEDIWNAIYPGSWERNDFVWRIEFKVIEIAK